MNVVALISSKPLATLIAFAVLVVLHLLFVKKTRLLVNVIALYVSLGVMLILPRIEQVRALMKDNALVRAGVLIALFFVIHLLLSYSNVRTVSERVSPSSFAASLVYRIAIVGLAVSLVLYPLPAVYQAQLGPTATLLFMSKIAFLVWLFIPFVLVFSYRFKTDSGWLE